MPKVMVANFCSSVNSDHGLLVNRMDREEKCTVMGQSGCELAY